jgi:hypothetical protein
MTRAPPPRLKFSMKLRREISLNETLRVINKIMVYETRPWRLVAWENYLKNKVCMKKAETIFACNPAAVDKEQRARYAFDQTAVCDQKRNRRTARRLRCRLFGKSANNQRDGRVYHLRAFMLPVSKFEMAIEGENLSLR